MIPTFRNWRVGCKFATITAVCHSCLRRTQLPLSSCPLPFPLFPQLLTPPSVHQYPPQDSEAMHILCNAGFPSVTQGGGPYTPDSPPPTFTV